MEHEPMTISMDTKVDIKFETWEMMHVELSR
jgi:hypothetical protein